MILCICDSITIEKKGARQNLLPFLLTKPQKRGIMKMQYVKPTYTKIEKPDSKGNFFVRLAYGVVGGYMDTKKMTTQQVIEEFLDHNGVDTPREFFKKKFKGKQKPAAGGTNISNVSNGGNAQIVSKPKSNATNVKEAEDIIKNYAKTVDYSGSKDIQRLNDINDVVVTLFQKYNLEMLQTISTASYKTANAKACYDMLKINKKAINNGIAKYDWQARIERNNRMINDPAYSDSFKQALIEENKYSRWSVSSSTGDIKDTITHEIGHIIADQYIGQINGTWANINYRNDPTNKCKIACDKIEAVYKKAKSNGDIYKISMYGASNKIEFFAESFSMYEKGEDLPDDIKNMVEEILKNGKL